MNELKKVSLRILLALVVMAVGAGLVITVSVTAQQTNTMRYVYDDNGRLRAVISPAGEVTVYDYDAAGNIRSISHGNSSQVSILAFTPDTGSRGSNVTLYGTGFSPTPAQNSITFNGVAATITSATATQLVAIVPNSATTGAIVVTTPVGTATSKAPFNVKPQPTITSFYPTVAPADSSITINGTNFESIETNNNVKFTPNVSATINNAFDTTINATVPTGARTGRLSVSTSAGTAVSNDYFFVSPSPYETNDVAFTGQMTIGESKLVTITSSGKIGIIVFEAQAGQKISLRLSNMTIPQTRLSVSVDGISIGSRDFTSNGGLLEMQPLTRTGTYTIVINEGHNSAGSMLLSLYDVPPDAVGTMAVGGPPVNIATTVPGQNARLTFSRTAFAQRLRLQLSNVTSRNNTIRITSPRGVTMGVADVGTQGGTIDTTALFEAGTYTISIDPKGDSFGALTLALTENSDVTGAIVVGGPPVSVTTTTPGQNAKLTFNAASLQRLHLQISGSTFTANRIYLFASNEQQLTTLFLNGDGVLDVEALTSSGTYLLLVDPQDNATGSLTLTLTENQDVTGAITIDGPPVSVSIPAANQNARLTFDAPLGQPLSLQISGATIPQSDVSIYNPSGGVFFQPRTIGTAGVVLNTRSTPAAGTYTIFIDPLYAFTGSLTVALRAVGTRDTTGTIAVNGPPVSINTTTPGQNATLTFNGTAGQKISLLMTNSTFPDDARVYVYKPDGTAFYSSGYYVDACNRLEEGLVLPATGSYAIQIDPYGEVTGALTLKLYETPPPINAPITIGGPPVTITNTIPGQDGRLTFDGTAGQVVSVGITNLNIPRCADYDDRWIDVYVKRPDGTQLAYTYVDMRRGGGFSQAITLPVNGTYTILVDHYGVNVGSLDVALYQVPPDVNVAINPDAQPVAVTTTAPGQSVHLNFNANANQRVMLQVSDLTIAEVEVFLRRPGETTSSYLTNVRPTGGYVSLGTLPASGAYTVDLRPYRSGAGGMTVKLYDVPADITGTISINGPPVNVTTTVPGQGAQLTFNGTAGQRLNLKTFNSTTNSLYASVRKPDGNFIYDAAFENFTLPVTGVYTVVVASTGAPGSLGVLLFEDSGPTDYFGSISAGGPPVTIRLPMVEQNARLVFNGTAGQRVSFNLTNITIGSPTVCGSQAYILKPDGSRLFTDFCVNGPTKFLEATTLPTDGTYSLVIDPYGSYTGDATVTMFNSPPDVVGAISIDGPPVNVTTTAPGQNARLTFSGVAGQRVSANLTGITIGTPDVCGSQVYLLKPDGSFLAANACANGPSNFFDATVLPVSGSYTLVIDPYGTNYGSMTVQMYGVPPDASGTITPGGPPVTVTTTAPGQNATLTFSGVAGQQISLKMTNVNMGVAGFCASREYVFNPDGTNLVNATCTPPEGDFVDNQTLPANGTYTINIDPLYNYTGSITLTLYNVPDITGPMTVGGPPQNLTTTLPGQKAKFTFSGTAGQKVNLLVSNITYPSVYVEVHNQSNTWDWWWNTTGVGQEVFDSMMLPDTGTYTIYVSPGRTYSDGYTGSLSLTLTETSQNLPQITIGGPPVTLSNTILGEYVRLRFNGTAGQRVALDMTGITLNSPGTCDVRAYLHKPDNTTQYLPYGVTLGFACLQHDSEFMDTVTLPETGVYEILVYPYISRGSVTFQLLDVPPVTGTLTLDGPPTSVNLTLPGQTAELTFNGTAGQVVGLDLSNITIGPPDSCRSNVKLNAPDGTTLAVNWCTDAAFASLGEAVTLPANGTYTVVVDPYDRNTGGMTLNLYTPPANATATLAVGGAPVILTTTVPRQNMLVSFAGTAGQHLSLDIGNITYGVAGQCSNSLTYRKPDGSYSWSYSCIESPHKFVDFYLNETGTSSFLLDPYDTYTGSATFKLQEVPADITRDISIGGAPQTLTINNPGQNGVFLFNGTAGQRVRLDMSGVTFGSVYVYVNNDDYSFYEWKQLTGGQNATLDATLPATGLYYLQVDPDDDSTGSITLKLYTPN